MTRFYVLVFCDRKGIIVELKRYYRRSYLKTQLTSVAESLKQHLQPCKLSCISNAKYMTSKKLV